MRELAFGQRETGDQIPKSSSNTLGKLGKHMGAPIQGATKRKLDWLKTK